MRNRAHSGFTHIELAAAVAVTGLLGAMLLVSGSESRRLARLGEDIAKLRQIGAWTGSYAADHSDAYWTYSWKKGHQLSQWPDLNEQALGSDNSANMAQAVDILRRLAGRTDIPPAMGLAPQLNYNHLPLLEFLRGGFPDTGFVSSADTNRLKWSRDPAGFDAGIYSPVPSGWGSGHSKRWPYSTSFRVSTSFYDTSNAGTRIYAHSLHSLLLIPSQATTGGRLLSDTAFPSGKAHVHDINARHFGPKQPYATHAEARLPILFADGALATRAAADANGGWQPNSPASGAPTTFEYAPDAWEPPTTTGTPSEIVTGRFIWTRGFLAGRDFGGPEVCTGQPGCP